MGDQLDVSADSVEIIEEDGGAEIEFIAPAKPSSSKVATTTASSAETADVVVLRGNALYARLAALMSASVSTADALAEMKEMSKQMASRKAAAGISELWDAGEEVGEGGGGGPPGGNRPPPKRVGPPTPIGAPNRVLASPSLADKRAGKPATTADKSSSSGSEESQDASSVSVDRAKGSASEISKPTSKLCIVCHEPASAQSVLLTCAVCTLPTHAKCVKPPVEKEDRASFTCATCTRRPRSESPKPVRSAIQITAPHDSRRRKAGEASNLSKSDEARRKRLEGEVKKKKSEEL